MHLRGISIERLCRLPCTAAIWSPGLPPLTDLQGDEAAHRAGIGGVVTEVHGLQRRGNNDMRRILVREILDIESYRESAQHRVSTVTARIVLKMPVERDPVIYISRWRQRIVLVAVDIAGGQRGRDGRSRPGKAAMHPEPGRREDSVE